MKLAHTRNAQGGNPLQGSLLMLLEDLIDAT
jgi:hypothetical protein